MNKTAGSDPIALWVWCCHCLTLASVQLRWVGGEEQALVWVGGEAEVGGWTERLWFGCWGARAARPLAWGRGRWHCSITSKLSELHAWRPCCLPLPQSITPGRRDSTPQWPSLNCIMVLRSGNSKIFNYTLCDLYHHNSNVYLFAQITGSLFHQNQAILMWKHGRYLVSRN